MSILFPGWNAAQTDRPEKEKKRRRSIPLSEYIDLVNRNNETIGAQRHELMISRENVTREKSVFEPEMVNSFEHGQDKRKYSQEEKTSQLFNNRRDKVSDNFGLVLQGKIPTGADVKFGYTEDVSNDRELDGGWEYKSYYGIEIAQPLLRNSGMASSAGIRAAEKDAEIQHQTFRIKKIEVMYSAISACWDYYGAKKKLEIRKGSVEIARKILNDNLERYKLGKIARTEVLEAEAGLAKRLSWEAGAAQDVVSAENEVRSYVSSSDVDLIIDVDVSEALKTDGVNPDFAGGMENAYHLRPEYIAAVKKIEKERILLSYAKNQRWPKLDLSGSYGLNGLGDALSDSRRDAFDQDFNTWHVGLTLTVPLFGDLKTGSELNAAEHRRKQALLELKAVETQIAAIIGTSVENVYATREQTKNYTRAREIEQGLLDVELEKLRSGKSNSRTVLEKEEDLNYAKEAELESIVSHQKAILALWVSDGSLLKRFEIDEAGESEKLNHPPLPASGE